ncbi:BglG family transcription antiterminator [Bacillus alkalicellulosilyticus]|uniref:BglG family transcription antiterminator n=1 Tax=Alkalihalobacterium alkalicellulosilyticum TaxID=1912214 RepID=UPI0009976A2F|nr:BglG family transcription antiterminator [Bacillus alkalicellulosilyticus]
MYISARERKILEHLLMRQEDTTVKDLANELDVSPRTVHRDLKGVEEILEEYGLGLHKKSGIGIHVTGNRQDIEKLQLFLFNLSHNEYTPEERQTIILSELLDAKEPIKLVSLANDLNVTIATVSNDLNKVEQKLIPFSLTLIRKRGYGVEITGAEKAKRKAMSKLIIEHLDEFEFISMIKESIQRKSTQTVDTVTDRLLGLVDKKKLMIIEKQINDVKTDLPYRIADSAYIGLVVHLALAIERIEQGEEINFDDEYLESLKGSKEFKVAEKIVIRLKSIFQIEITEGEIGYITMHLMGAKLRNEREDVLEESSFQIGLITQQLIRNVSLELGRDLTSDISLFQGLVAHLRPALYRIKQHMGISNPLLSRIMEDYPDIFAVVIKVVKETFTELNVPKEEVGYLVMHFASALLNKNDVKVLKALIVCSSGIGTSKMLSSKLEQVIPGIKAVNASLFDLDSIDIAGFDGILSTVPLKSMKDEYLLVSPILSEVEIGKIKKYLLKQKTAPLLKRTDSVSKGEMVHRIDFLEKISNANKYTSAMYQLLHGFSVFRFEERVTLEAALSKMCENLLELDVIGNSSHVYKDLIAREHLGGLGIPGTSVALYHTKSEEIKKPSFSIARVNHSITVKAMDNSTIEMDSLLLMLSPHTSNEQTMELLSTISALVIKDEETTRLFESGQEHDIAALITSEFNSIYEKKVLY